MSCSMEPQDICHEALGSSLIPVFLNIPGVHNSVGL